MSTSQLTTVVGNPRTPSRTLAVAESFARSLATSLGAQWSPARLIDLAASGPYDPAGAASPRDIDLIESADLVIVATPVYKASFTGLLKLFFDRLPATALRDTVVVPVTISGSASHRLLAELALAPVLAELGARRPVPGLTLEERELPDVETVVSEWMQRNLRLLSATVHTGQLAGVTR